MPRKKTAVFVTVITALLVVMVLSVAMSVHHYEKTVLITLDAAGEQAAENETGLAEIRRQLGMVLFVLQSTARGVAGQQHIMYALI